MRSQEVVDSAGLWDRYKRGGDASARDDLILAYAPLVKYVASRLGAGLPAGVDNADLVSYGIFGLIDAIEKYDLERGNKFETYAIARIRGAIIDQLRNLDWVPRSVRSHARHIEQAYLELGTELHRVPTDEEVAARLGVSTADYDSMLVKVSQTAVVSFEDLLSSGGDDHADPLSAIADDGAENPAEVVDRHAMKEILAKSVAQLAEREMSVIALYYYDGFTLKEIGDVLGVTESRVSQIHTKAVLQLRALVRAALAA